MPLDPDTHALISLIGSAERLYYDRGDRAAAVAELRNIADGRTDLLNDAAGHFIGTDTWNSRPCYLLLRDAGATDQKRIDAAAERARSNLAGAGHTTAGTQSRRWPTN